jgi:hypothetical protein
MLCIICIGTHYRPHVSSRTIIHGDGGVVDIWGLIHEASGVTSDKLTGEGATSDKKH